MYAVTKHIPFCYGHRLMNHRGKCRNLHGHNGKLEIELSAATLNDLGMVRDFEDIKRSIQGWIDEHLDHRMVLRADDPALPALRTLGEPVFVMENNPTAEVLAKLIYDVAHQMKLPVRAVRLWETERSCATYQPTRTRPRVGTRPRPRRVGARTVARRVSSTAA